MKPTKDTKLYDTHHLHSQHGPKISASESSVHCFCQHSDPSFHLDVSKGPQIPETMHAFNGHRLEARPVDFAPLESGLQSEFRSHQHHPWIWSSDDEPVYSLSDPGRRHAQPVRKNLAHRSQRPPTSPVTITKVSPLDGEDSHLHQRFHKSDPTSSGLLSPLSFTERFGPLKAPKQALHSCFEPSCVTEGFENCAPNEDLILSPLDWNSRRNSLLASPFSEDSDLDDGALVPSPFSSPGSWSQPDVDGENGRYRQSMSLPTRDHRYPLDAYPHLGLYRDHIDDDREPHALSTSSPAWSLPSLSSSPSSVGSDLAYDQFTKPPSSPSSYFSSGAFSSTFPCSPHSRALDLPPLETEANNNSNGFGLSQPSYTSSYSPTGLQIDQDTLRMPKRSTFVSLPGADTDDDLIPLDLASKNYIPDPGLALPTAPLSRSLLIWDPSTRSGLSANLPPFNGASSGIRLDSDLLLGRPPSSDDDFEVDPVLLAELAEKDAEKWVEIQKLCELKQRTTMAATLAASRNWRNGGGAQMKAERVKERFREVTALLRLKLTLDETKVKESDDVDREAAKGGSNVSARDNTFIRQWSASELCEPAFASPLFKTPGSEEALAATIGTSDSATVMSEALPKSPPSGSHPNEMVSSPAPRMIMQCRTSKPKITSMAQLVANMVLHRQQEGIRRSPPRSRPLSPPTSPLRQMTLPEELSDGIDSDSEDGEVGGVVACDSPTLQLSPLCLTPSGPPESFYAQLESSNPQFFL